MTEKLKSRMKELDRSTRENLPILRQRAPNADPVILEAAAKYREALERLAQE